MKSYHLTGGVTHTHIGNLANLLTTLCTLTMALTFMDLLSELKGLGGSDSDGWQNEEFHERINYRIGRE